ncbi:MAG TPA: helix-turn-helix domain-containing protein [Sphingobacterium bovisgrunnientis]|nr:helix-turn-helix domain-containing protein [Sphingobacterium bovisgrunnientis]
MDNPFITLSQRLEKIEDLIINLENSFRKLNLSEMKTNREPEFLDATQVAELAKVKLTTIYAYNTRGTIPIYSSETPIIYKREEIIEWLEHGKQLTDRLVKLMDERKSVKK